MAPIVPSRTPLNTLHSGTLSLSLAIPVSKSSPNSTGDEMAAVAVASASASKLAARAGSPVENADGGRVGNFKVIGQAGGRSLGGSLIHRARLSGGQRSENSRSTRRNLCIVAASPPKKDDGIRSGEPLTKQDLVGYLASGCKPKERWRWVEFQFWLNHAPM
jgi:hypothetical protein